MASIAIVNNFFPPRTSGSAHLSEVEAAGLAARGHEVLVLTASYADAPTEELRDGFRVVRLNALTLPRLRFAFNFDMSFAATPRNVRRLFRLLDDFAPDVIHQHGQFFDLTFASSWYARRRRIPTLLSIHTRLESPSRFQNAIFALGDMTLVRFFVAISRPSVVVMDRLMDAYIRRRYRVKGARLVPIPVGVEPDRFAGADGSAVRAQLRLGDRPMILSLGHVIPVRDRLTLVRAMPAVLAQVPTAVLVIVGALYDERFLAVADELGVSDHIVTTGAVPKDEVPGFVAAANVESHDLDGYGLGTASLEVMAAGVPTVAAVRADNFLGLELRNWIDVALVPPGDSAAVAGAIVRLLQDPELAATLVVGQKKLIEENFSTEVITDLHEKALVKLADS